MFWKIHCSCVSVCVCVFVGLCVFLQADVSLDRCTHPFLFHPPVISLLVMFPTHRQADLLTHTHIHTVAHAHITPCSISHISRSSSVKAGLTKSNSVIGAARKTLNICLAHVKCSPRANWALSLVLSSVTPHSHPAHKYISHFQNPEIKSVPQVEPESLWHAALAAANVRANLFDI